MCSQKNSSECLCSPHRIFPHLRFSPWAVPEGPLWAQSSHMLQLCCYLRVFSKKCRQRMAYEAFEAESCICFPLSSHPRSVWYLALSPWWKAPLKPCLLSNPNRKAINWAAFVSRLHFFRDGLFFTSHTHVLEHTGCQMCLWTPVKRDNLIITHAR